MSHIIRGPNDAAFIVARVQCLRRVLKYDVFPCHTISVFLPALAANDCIVSCSVTSKYPKFPSANAVACYASLRSRYPFLLPNLVGASAGFILLVVVLIYIPETRYFEDKRAAIRPTNR